MALALGTDLEALQERQLLLPPAKPLLLSLWQLSPVAIWDAESACYVSGLNI